MEKERIGYLKSKKEKIKDLESEIFQEKHGLTEEQVKEVGKYIIQKKYIQKVDYDGEKYTPKSVDDQLIDIRSHMFKVERENDKLKDRIGTLKFFTIISVVVAIFSFVGLLLHG